MELRTQNLRNGTWLNHVSKPRTPLNRPEIKKLHWNSKSWVPILNLPLIVWLYVGQGSCQSLSFVISEMKGGTRWCLHSLPVLRGFCLFICLVFCFCWLFIIKKGQKRQLIFTTFISCPALCTEQQLKEEADQLKKTQGAEDKLVDQKLHESMSSLGRPISGLSLCSETLAHLEISRCYHNSWVSIKYKK